MRIISNPAPTTVVPNQRSSHDVYDNQVTIQLEQGETFEVEPGAFIAGRHVVCQTRGASSGYLNACARLLFANESLFTNTFKGEKQGNSWISIAPPHIGQIARYKFKGTSDKIYLVSDSYLASTSNVKLSAKYQGISDLKGMGITTIQASVEGAQENDQAEVLFHSETGSVMPIEVTPGNPVIVDNRHIIAFTGKRNELHCNYRMLSGGAMGFFGSGEGYVCQFSGTGTVFVRTHQPPVRPS